MRILFYVPDNHITHNYMPTLWPHLLRALTPAPHRVTIVDGNVMRLSPEELAQFLRRGKVDLVGIGGMTRTIHRSYQVADRVHALGIPVVMGGPHVSEELEEALEHADAVVIGEADTLWPKLLADFEAGRLQRLYHSDDKPSLENYPQIAWEGMDLRYFTLLPAWLRRLLKATGKQRYDINVTPIESGRGCPYGCDFCTVTSFFGEKVRFRPAESVVEELHRLKKLGRTFIFFVDDNFVINPARTKALLEAMLAADVCLPWAAQVSVNLLRDPELLALMHRSGCIGLYIGLESVLAESLADVHKSFNKPEQYAAILESLHRRGIYTVTSFIFGMDADRAGVAQQTWEVLRQWSPQFFPVFGQLTPLPGTPLYDKLRQQGRLEERHWMNYRPYGAAFDPTQMTREELEEEIQTAWSLAYAPENIYERLRQMNGKSVPEKLIYLFATLVFRGVYFRQMGVGAWLKAVLENRRALWEALTHRTTPEVAA